MRQRKSLATVVIYLVEALQEAVAHDPWYLLFILSKLIYQLSRSHFDCQVESKPRIKPEVLLGPKLNELSFNLQHQSWVFDWCWLITRAYKVLSFPAAGVVRFVNYAKELVIINRWQECKCASGVEEQAVAHPLGKHRPAFNSIPFQSDHPVLV